MPRSHSGLCSWRWPAHSARRCTAASTWPAALHPYTVAEANAPSAIDPRGLLTFGASGIGLWVFSWLILRSTSLPRGLGYLGYLVAALQIVLYLGRLIVLEATNPVIVVPALLAGFIVTPIWYVWLGVSLLRGART